jgi:hypothetical protein
MIDLTPARGLGSGGVTQLLQPLLSSGGRHEDRCVGLFDGAVAATAGAVGKPLRRRVGSAQPLQPPLSSGVCGMTGVSGCWTAQPLQLPPPSAKAVAVRATNAIAAKTASFMLPSIG